MEIGKNLVMIEWIMTLNYKLSPSPHITILYAMVQLLCACAVL